MSNPDQLERARLVDVEALVWADLSAGAHDRNHPFHTPVLATAHRECPRARTVVLRHVDPDVRVLRCHADLRSPKIEQLNECSHVTWLFYDAGARVQIRASGNMTIHHQDGLAREGWDAATENSRLCYRHSLAPGIGVQKVGQPPTYIPTDGFENFAVLRCVLDQIDWLFLSSSGHKRCSLTFHQDQWHGQWLAP